MSPYPSPYSDHPSQRPSTSPHPADDHAGAGGIPRVRSMIQLPSVDSYPFNPAQADFAYAVDENSGHGAGMYGAIPSRSVRPSTSASSRPRRDSRPAPAPPTSHRRHARRACVPANSPRPRLPLLPPHPCLVAPPPPPPPDPTVLHPSHHHHHHPAMTDVSAPIPFTPRETLQVPESNYILPADEVERTRCVLFSRYYSM